MADKKNTNEIEYIKVCLPDREAMAAYLEKGKGKGRSMEKYARDCGSSPATFHRISVGDFQRSLPAYLVRAIVDNASEGCLDLDRVMRANGMVRINDGSNRRNEIAHGVERDERTKLLNDIADKIRKELYAKGFLLRFFHVLPVNENREDFPKSRYGLPYNAGDNSFAFHLRGYEPKYWYFVVNGYELDKNESEPEDVFPERQQWYRDKMLCEVMNQLGRFFLKDLWEPETMRQMKVIFVFAERKRFEILKEVLRDRKVNGHFSLMLLDMDSDNEAVKEEFILPRIQGETEKSVFE